MGDSSAAPAKTGHDVTTDAYVDPAVGLAVIQKRKAREYLVRGVLLAAVALALHSVITNERFQWGVVFEFLAAPTILRGVAWTIGLTAMVSVIALPLSVLIALMRMSSVRLAQGIAWLFTWLFRSIPGLVQLLFWYNLAALYPTVSFGIPFGPAFFDADTNSVLTPLTAAVIGLTLHEAAYFTEIFRGSLMSVDKGQRQAALAVGMNPKQSFMWVVLPQATRVAIPPTVSQVIHLVKATSLVSVIAMTDLLYSAQLIYLRNYKTIPLLIVVCIWYLLITTVLSALQSRLERRFGRGVAH